MARSGRYTGRQPDKRKYLSWMYIAVMWAVSIHLVTAFLLAGLPARPFWNTALLGPRFLASAFTAGPAFVILLLGFIRRETKYEIAEGALAKLALITTVAAQINLVMLGCELFYKFYVRDAERAALEVQDYDEAVILSAQTALRDAMVRLRPRSRTSSWRQPMRTTITPPR